MSYPVVVVLTASELCREYEHAEQIVFSAEEMHRTPNFGFKSRAERISATFVGRLGELALAKYLNVDYRYEDYDRNAYDVDGGYEVRTRRRAHYDLFTYDTDKPAVYVLATVSTDYVIRLRGWITLEEANVPEHWTDRHGLKPCYLTPQHELHNMTTIPRQETRHHAL